MIKTTVNTGLSQAEAIAKVLESAKKLGFEATREEDLADGTARILLRKGMLTKVIGIADEGDHGQIKKLSPEKTERDSGRY